MTKIRAGYKETEIGVIPEDWEVAELSSISELITKGTTPTTYGYEFVDDGVNFVKIESINDNYGTLLSEAFSKITEECHLKLNRSILKSGDILFAIAGATIGKCAMIQSEHLPANTNQALAIIRLNKSENKQFVFHQLRGYYIQQRIGQIKTNTAQPNLNLKQIGEFKFAYPKDFKEQQRIAEILSTTDAHIEKLDKTIEDYQLLKKGMMKKLLTEGIGHTEFKETEIGRVPKEWEVVTQGEISTFYNGRAYKQTEFRETGTPIIRIQNLTGEGRYVYSDLKLENDKYILKGDLIYAWSATFGPYIWNGSMGIYHYHIWKVECSNRIDKMFFYYRLYQISDELSSKKNGSVFAHITKGFMENHKIALPPMEEQLEIANMILTIDERCQLYIKNKEDCIEVKKALMEQLLTGKIRVRKVEV